LDSSKTKNSCDQSEGGKITGTGTGTETTTKLTNKIKDEAASKLGILYTLITIHTHCYYYSSQTFSPI